MHTDIQTRFNIKQSLENVLLYVAGDEELDWLRQVHWEFCDASPRCPSSEKGKEVKR
jgi:hypothetical protein